MNKSIRVYCEDFDFTITKINQNKIRLENPYLKKSLINSTEILSSLDMKICSVANMEISCASYIYLRGSHDYFKNKVNRQRTFTIDFTYEEIVRNIFKLKERHEFLKIEETKPKSHLPKWW